MKGQATARLLPHAAYCQKPTNLFLVRHGARLDFVRPEWKLEAEELGHEFRDPPLSILGHRQARETAAYISVLPDHEKPARLLTSPFLRVIQTAAPTADALGLPLEVEEGLAETHYIPNRLPSPAERFPYFPQLKPTSLSALLPSTDELDFATGLPSESFPRGYLNRQLLFAPILSKIVDGSNVCCFSHAASVALVAALLLRPSSEDLNDAEKDQSGILAASEETQRHKDLSTVGAFAPCGIYHLRAKGGGAPWELVRSGGTNEPYVTENHPSTFPWSHDLDHDALWKKLVAASTSVELK
mmetsp:Transcript_56497/g.113156  ORF Transcript_56497/g.113156 Transcript_56497/m.113156 type:complete len:300 (+) Transcript_56497:22-921(+)